MLSVENSECLKPHGYSFGFMKRKAYAAAGEKYRIVVDNELLLSQYKAQGCSRPVQ